MNILFIDHTCPKPYTLTTLATEALGGTEATVLRIANALAHKGHNVAIEQRGRLRNELEPSNPNLFYLPEGKAAIATHVIALRDPGLAINVKVRFPRARAYLWSHDLATRQLGPYIGNMSQMGITQIAVSNWHKTQIVDVLRPQGYTGQYPIKVIYNPIDDNLSPTGVKYDPYKLVFFSSPHKGLKDTLGLFECIRRIEPLFRLYVGNPGYFPLGDVQGSGVEVLGPIPHATILSHVEGSLCVFYPNKVFPETFGLVFAESNAVGTPVFGHPIGAAREVLSSPGAQLHECNHIQKVVDTVISWKDGARPIVSAKPEFRLAEVVKAWERLLIGS